MHFSCPTADEDLTNAAVPVHGAFVQDYNILSTWKIAYNHPLVQYWKDIPRHAGFVQGSVLDRDLAFKLASRVDDTPAMSLLECDMNTLLNASGRSQYSGTGRCREVSPDMLALVSSNERYLFPLTMNEIASPFCDAIIGNLFFGVTKIHLMFRTLSLYSPSNNKRRGCDDKLASGVPSNHEGTLLLEIISPHTGGKMSFSVDGSTVDWDLSANGPRQHAVRWCAFRNHATYEIHPVPSGVLALLQFDIAVHKPAMNRKRPREEEDEGLSDDDGSDGVDSDEYSDQFGMGEVGKFERTENLISSNCPVPACDCQEFLAALLLHRSQLYCSPAVPLLPSECLFPP